MQGVAEVTAAAAIGLFQDVAGPGRSEAGIDAEYRRYTNSAATEQLRNEWVSLLLRQNVVDPWFQIWSTCNPIARPGLSASSELISIASRGRW